MKEYKKVYPETSVVWLDNGNFSDNPTPAGDIKTEALIQGMNILDYTAVNIGERELFLGYEEFQEKVASAKFQLVTANLVLKGTEESITKPYIIKKVKTLTGKTCRIGILGLTKFNQTFQKSGPKGKNIITIHPVEAAKKYIPIMREKVDIIIVLAAMAKDETHLLAKNIPGIDIILASHGGIFTAGKEVEGSTQIIYTGNKGGRIFELRLYLDDQNKLSDMVKHAHYLTRGYPDDKEMLNFVTETLQKVNEIRKQRKPQHGRGSQKPAIPSFVTAKKCKTCHEEAFAIWEKSKHANAFLLVVEKGKASDAACQRCHVTGYKKILGFKNEKESANLLHVQCEACHGAGSFHPEQVKAGYGRHIRISTCVSCHTKKWSPDFNYYEYYPKIKH